MALKAGRGPPNPTPPARREVSVQIFEAEAPDGSPSANPAVEGTMVFADTYPSRGARTAAAAAGAPSKWTADTLYGDVMFHGPAFRGVVSMDRWGEDGAEATLQVLPSTGLFRSSANPALLTDPILLDQPGQVVGFWIAEHLEPRLRRLSVPPRGPAPVRPESGRPAR